MGVRYRHEISNDRYVVFWVDIILLGKAVLPIPRSNRTVVISGCEPKESVIL
jgi:hypothetical protein